jgi:hypothetical protein
MTTIKKKSPIKKRPQKSKNKTILLILSLPVILIITYNEFYHYQIHKTAETITSSLKTIIPYKIKDFSKTKSSIIAPQVSEVNLANGKLLITSKTSLNPVMNHVELDYKPLRPDQSPLKFNLQTQFLDLDSMELLLQTQSLTTDINDVETDMRNIEMKMKLPLELILKSNNNLIDYLKAGIDIEFGKMNLTDIKTKKNIYKIDGMNIKFQIEEINSASLKNKLSIGFKKLTVPGDTKKKASTLTDSNVIMTIGNFNKNELIKMISNYNPKQVQPGLQAFMSMGNIFDEIDISLENNGTYETKPFKIDGTLKISEMANLPKIMDSIELQANIDLSHKIIIEIVKQKLTKSIKEHFLKDYQSDDLDTDEEIERLEMLISEKIPDDLIKKVIGFFLDKRFLRSSRIGLLLNFNYSKGLQKINGSSTSLQMVNLQIEELIKIFYRNKMDLILEGLNYHINENGFAFTKKIKSTPESFLIPDVTQPPSVAVVPPSVAVVPPSVAVVPPQIIAPNLNIRKNPINHKPASSLEKVQNDKYFQDFRDKKYQDCWVNENVSGYTQIFTLKTFRGNYTDLQADAFLAILPAYVKKGECKLK